MGKRSWELLPYFIVRSTGFPFDWLEDLSFRETVAEIDKLLDLEEAITALGNQLQEKVCAKHRGGALETVYQHIRSALRSKQHIVLSESTCGSCERELRKFIDQWNSLLAEYSTCDTRARAVFSQEMAKRRRALYERALNQDFQEAVWLSSPHMYEYGLVPYLEHWRIDHRPSDVRRIERQLVSYFQRFCAKNDTASFFGPINYGDFFPPSANALPGPGCHHIQQRRAFMAFWGVSALATAIAKDEHVQPYLCPRYNPICQLDRVNGQAWIGHNIQVTLTERQIRLLQIIDNNHTIQQIAQALKLPIEDILIEANKLASAHIISLHLEVPVTRPEALEWLLAWVHALPHDCPTRSRWSSIVEECKHLQDQFALASFAEKRQILSQLERVVTNITGQMSQRGAGQFYADRLLIYEECLGGVSTLSLGPRCLAELQEQLFPVLNAYANHACALHQVLQTQGAQTLIEMSPDGTGAMPLLLFLQHQKIDPVSSGTVECSWLQAIYAQIAERADEHIISLESTQIPTIAPSIATSTPLLTSPDIMLVASNEESLRSGDFQIVVAECHDTLMVWGWALYFHPDKKAVHASAQQLLRRMGFEKELANILPSKRAKIIPFEYPGPTIEILASSEKPETERIPIARVETGIIDGKPVLQALGYAHLRLYNGELQSFHHNIFAIPRIIPCHIELPYHTPRIMLGKAVLQREQWRIARKTLLPGKYRGTSFELMRDFRRSARRLGIPRYLFLRVPGERKPIFIDRDSYFSLELLDYLLPQEGEVLFQEMLPLPDQLWLRNEEGMFCAELRLSAAYTNTKEGK